MHNLYRIDIALISTVNNRHLHLYVLENIMAISFPYLHYYLSLNCLWILLGHSFKSDHLYISYFLMFVCFLIFVLIFGHFRRIFCQSVKMWSNFDQFSRARFPNLGLSPIKIDPQVDPTKFRHGYHRQLNWIIHTKIDKYD